MALVNSLKWSFLSAIGSRIVQPLIYVFLARILTPEDFGIMTAAFIIIAFSQIFWEAGMGKALIQRQTFIDEAANVAFWVNIAVGFVVASALYLSAPLIGASIFEDNKTIAVLQVMTLQVVLGAFGSVHTALLQKEMHFKKLFWVRLIAASVPALASIPLALEGAGYWALVGGAILGQFAQVVFLWRFSGWRPRATFSLLIARQMVRFGSWVALTGFLAWFYLWADSLFIAKFFELDVVGEYRVSNELITVIFGFAFAPVMPVLYSFMSKNVDEFRNEPYKLELLSAVSMWLALPIGAILYFVSDNIIVAFLGENWVGASKIFALMAVVHAVAYLSAFNGEIYRALGRPDLESRVLIIGVFFYSPAYYFLANISMDAFLYGRVILILFFLPIHNFILCLLIGSNQMKILVNQVLLAAFLLSIACLIDFFVKGKNLSHILEVVVFVIVFGVVVITAFIFLESKRLLPMARLIFVNSER